MSKAIVPASPESEPHFLLYQTEDHQTRVDLRLQGGTVWLSLNQLAELYQRDKSVISKHLKNIFEEGEQPFEGTVAKFATVQREGDREVTREIECYRLEVILAVGYRVKSVRGMQFRRWATERLQEYLVKGFVMDDERLKNPGADRPDYFEELLARIRDIRSSEKVFYRKVLDIYATSIDYDPSADASKIFFSTVQNKMHWAAHGHTAAEIVHQRADAKKPFMGLAHVEKGRSIRKSDAFVAKNYLQPEELEGLNRIVNAYLEFAELQAQGRRAMHMQDWISKLDAFLKLSERAILTHAGKISHELAEAKAALEFQKFKAIQIEQPSQGEKDFDAAVKKLPKLRKKKS